MAASNFVGESGESERKETVVKTKSTNYDTNVNTEIRATNTIETWYMTFYGWQLATHQLLCK